jgi:hypothetical protein
MMYPKILNTSAYTTKPATRKTAFIYLKPFRPSASDLGCVPLHEDINSIPPRTKSTLEEILGKIDASAENVNDSKKTKPHNTSSVIEK